MSEQGSGGGGGGGGGGGVGPFLFGLGIGAALGFLFAPEPGAASRSKLGRRLRELAAEKVGELGKLVELADDEGAPTTRATLARRLAEAKRRRRGSRASVDEESAPPA
ncbi:MAG TPA: YtxH domain-containing protein [Gemmatimonadales bacterium]|nr:YtxH domain-containing protein [Gemmatimonadales bacterium]